MTCRISSTKVVEPGHNLLILADQALLEEPGTLFIEQELNLLKSMGGKDSSYAIFPKEDHFLIVLIINTEGSAEQIHEKARKDGFDLLDPFKNYGIEQLTIQNFATTNLTLQVAEGLALGNYRFLKYYNNPEKKAAPLKEIFIHEAAASPSAVEHLNIVTEATCKARDLINEPLSYLTAVQLSEEIKKMGDDAGFDVTVLNMEQIKALQMGGIIAVNAGSFDPPSFTIMEWQPENPVNSHPIVLVGKGVVYDTGGLSLKPTRNSMDFMKSDMGGAAVVCCAMYAVAKAKLPIHLIVLVPATDNRPGNNAYAPGDVIKMYNGSTVEVLNTDAEGRMILADALHYAKRYHPELVIDFATLTGSAARAVGPHGMVMMGTASQAQKDNFRASGFKVHERLVEFPLWPEYGEMLKSEIADLKNIGGSYSGAITAGKFLQHFTDYPWIHVDIAGSAFLQQGDSYRGKQGTGVGVRLMFDFLSNYGK